MILIGKQLLSEDIFDVKFSCDISACKGDCCIEGEGGAPLTEEECAKLDEIFDDVKPYLRKEGLEEIEKHGFFKMDPDGELVTPLIEGRACAYATFDSKGIIHCGIESAYRDGKTDFQKPVSCHLYPIRVKELIDYTALNYHRWTICGAALICGSAKDISVLEFCKEGLIRRFSKEWYEEALHVMKVWREEKDEEKYGN